MSSNFIELPTMEAINGLPHWARVAFAARCVRRVEPLFVATWTQAPAKHVEAVEKAIVLSELSADAAHPVGDTVRSDALAGADAAYLDARVASDAKGARVVLGAALIAAAAARAVGAVDPRAAQAAGESAARAFEIADALADAADVFAPEVLDVDTYSGDAIAAARAAFSADCAAYAAAADADAAGNCAADAVYLTAAAARAACDAIVGDACVRCAEILSCWSAR